MKQLCCWILLGSILSCPLAASDSRQFSGKLGFAHGALGSNNILGPHFNGHVVYEIVDKTYIGAVVGIGIPGPTTMLIGGEASYELPFVNLDLIGAFRAVSQGLGKYQYSVTINPGLTFRLVEWANRDNRKDGLYFAISKSIFGLDYGSSVPPFFVPSLGMNLEVGYFLGF